MILAAWLGRLFYWSRLRLRLYRLLDLTIIAVARKTYYAIFGCCETIHIAFFERDNVAIIRPFRAIRPTEELAAKVASPPYDVLSSDEARALVKENPNSFLRVNKSEVDFPAEADVYGEQIYKRGRENLERLLNEKVMFRDEIPCFYLYRLTWQGRSQTGIAALTSVDEYNAGKIKKHEHTRPVKVNDRANHIMALNAQVGPVFSIFRQTSDIATLFTELTNGKPDVDFTADDSVVHQLWVVKEEKGINALVDAFADLPELYIADGHHRSEAASEVCRRMREKHSDYTGEEPFNFFLNVIFPDDQVRILPYNRVVNTTNGHSIEQMIELASKSFDITPADTPVNPEKDHVIGIYASGQWYELKSKEGSYDTEHAVESIDSAVLTANFLIPVLGIEDLRTDDRIDFIGGIRGTKELIKLVDSGDYKMAFALPPVRVEQLLAVADAGEVMPPKSTWFEPKLRSGMVVNPLDS